MKIKHILISTIEKNLSLCVMDKGAKLHSFASAYLVAEQPKGTGLSAARVRIWPY